MVDVAAIFDEVFGPAEQSKGSSEKRCVRCVGVFNVHKPLEDNDIPNTLGAAEKHTSNQGVSRAGERCARDAVDYQGIADQDTPTHQTHLKMETPGGPADPAAFEERAAVIEHDCDLPREHAETQAAREQGFEHSDDLHATIVARWAAEIYRLAEGPAASREAAEVLRQARAFVAGGWALQAARLGWDELQLFGVSPAAPWRRRDRKGAAFGGAVQAVTAEAVVYVGGLRRYRAMINTDGGAVPIWELAGETG